MSGYNIEYFLRDFSERTNSNLDIIYGIKEGTFREEDLFRLRHNSSKNYEVTQLINSLLGLIIIPAEASKKIFVDEEGKIHFPNFFNISEKDSNEIISLIEKCKREKRYYSDYFEPKSNNRKIGHFIYHIRNSLAHGGAGGLHFYPVQEDKEITDIIFYEKNIKDEKERCIKLSIDEIKKLENNINNLLCGYEKRESDCESKVNQYNKRIEELEEKMKNYEIKEGKYGNI